MLYRINNISQHRFYKCHSRRVLFNIYDLNTQQILAPKVWLYVKYTGRLREKAKNSRNFEYASEISHGSV